MCADLWSFALSTYARPGAEDACLRLQAQGADVCMVLCGLWLERRGVAPEPTRLQALRQIAGPWQADVVAPLRHVRTQWRAMAQHDAELGALRERVKALELEAERLLLSRLEGVAQHWPMAEVNDQAWLEGLTAGAANLDHDALHQLRAAVTGT
ncbi:MULTISPECIES: TIGR02444 family protein [unclassified Pseudomonas]|uniref:TIGR02444 family protein n=1 Tax=unclassified Pseudomonas TaxID=196821 RepID=UPI0015A3AF01|nr:MULTISPECIES: TIGR02444 family protein [unclassified Pseudomonas]NWC93409.1 TIGR02444 family protein [Pseudomonas sp. IPO3779]NWD18624.1 TIGR02444 family protein [Pseudomonas sp. IPO3778]